MSRESWQVVALMSGLLGILGGAEWFVTYCAFSDYCPLVISIAGGLVGG
jgi:hypothetical protein